MGKSINFEAMEESIPIVNHVEARHKKGLYTLILTTGLPGTGKSSKDQRLGELICERLETGPIKPEDIVDSLLTFVRRVRAIKNPGEVIIIEEVSVLFPSRRAMSRDNVDIARILDTCRKKRVILLANAPLFPTIDSHVRAMAHILTETLRINKTVKVVVYKGWRLQTNPGSGKTYKHTFQRDGKDVQRFFTRLPNQEVWNRYETNKDAFMDKVYDKIERESEERERGKGKRETAPKKERLELTQKEQQTYTLYYKDNMSMGDISKLMGVHHSMTSKRLKNIRDKIRKAKEIGGFDVLKAH